MNTPTPAQALRDVMSMCRVLVESTELADAEKFGYAFLKFIAEHGQHFAGLEAEVSELRDQVNFYHLASNTAALDDLRERASRAEAAESRAREAEGLLRHWQAWICGPSELHKATATFIAANRETK